MSKAKKVNTSGKLDVSKLSDGDIQDLFTDAFEQQVASENNIDSFEAISKRGTGGINLEMEVTITGLAGSPTIEDYRKNKVRGGGSVTIGSNDGRGTLKFNLDAKRTTSLNTNDFLVVYVAEK